MLLGMSQSYGEMLTVCEDLVKRKETPENLLLLAGAYSLTGHPDFMMKQLERAVKIAPGDFSSQIGLAAMLLKRTDDASLAQAAEHIRLARTALEKLPSNGDNAQMEVEYIFTAGLYQALAGDTERARSAFHAVLERDPGYDKAKEALKALE